MTTAPAPTPMVTLPRAAAKLAFDHLCYANVGGEAKDLAEAALRAALDAPATADATARVRELEARLAILNEERGRFMPEVGFLREENAKLSGRVADYEGHEKRMRSEYADTLEPKRAERVRSGDVILFQAMFNEIDATRDILGIPKGTDLHAGLMKLRYYAGLPSNGKSAAESVEALAAALKTAEAERDEARRRLGYSERTSEARNEMLNRIDEAQKATQRYWEKRDAAARERVAVLRVALRQIASGEDGDGCAYPEDSGNGYSWDCIDRSEASPCLPCRASIALAGADSAGRPATELAPAPEAERDRTATAASRVVTNTPDPRGAQEGSTSSTVTDEQVRENPSGTEGDGARVLRASVGRVLAGGPGKEGSEGRVAGAVQGGQGAQRDEAPAGRAASAAPVPAEPAAPAAPAEPRPGARAGASRGDRSMEAGLASDAPVGSVATSPATASPPPDDDVCPEPQDIKGLARLLTLGGKAPSLDHLLYRSEPPAPVIADTAAPPPDGKCADCGAGLNAGEAATFTVCDECWDKAKGAPAGSGAPPEVRPDLKSHDISEAASGIPSNFATGSARLRNEGPARDPLPDRTALLEKIAKLAWSHHQHRTLASFKTCHLCRALTELEGYSLSARTGVRE